MSNDSAVCVMASPLVRCSPEARIGGAMNVSDVLPDPDAAATTLLAAVTSGLSLVREPRLLRARFEEELRTLVQARSVAVREFPSDPSLQPAVVSFDVPGTPWATPAWLEATFEPAQPVDDWQRRTLSVAAHVASLLVQIEYASGRWGRPRRADGAAPLIGSSMAIRLVRDRIERVAATDFTVLVEGGSGPQPHPYFIEVFGDAAVCDGDGEVARAGPEAVIPHALGRRQDKCRLLAQYHKLAKSPLHARMRMSSRWSPRRRSGAALGRECTVSTAVRLQRRAEPDRPPATCAVCGKL